MNTAPQPQSEAIKICPFCREEIRAEAIKCRYCSSSLLPPQPPNGTDQPAQNNGRNQVIYVLDQDLVRFAKFAISTLAIFVAVGAFLYGFKIEETADKAQKSADTVKQSADTVRQAQDFIAKARDEVSSEEAQARQSSQSLQQEVSAVQTQQANTLKSITDAQQVVQKQVQQEQASAEKMFGSAQASLQEQVQVIENLQASSKKTAAEVEAARASIAQTQVQVQEALKQIEEDKKRADARVASLVSEGQGPSEAGVGAEEGSHPNPTGFTVPEIARLYSFPSEFNGEGQTVGIIELGGGYRDADLESYFASLKLPHPKVSWIGVDGSKNAPGSGGDAEVVSNVEIAGAVAPGAHIVVYFAPNTNVGFLDAIISASHDTKNHPSVILIAWGQPESRWTGVALKKYDKALEDAAQLCITVVCASGDSGAGDGETDGKRHVDFPGSSPWVLAVGGTAVTAANGKIVSEVVWNDYRGNGGATGGGVSDAFSQPTWQSGVKVVASSSSRAGRGVPDVAAIASPETGIQVVLDGKKIALGGTDASASLWAGLIALLNQAVGSNLGYFNPLLYGTIGPSGALRSITQGNNTYNGVQGCSAALGWNECTGWGSPDGTKLLEALRSQRPKS